MVFISEQSDITTVIHNAYACADDGGPREAIDYIVSHTGGLPFTDDLVIVIADMYHRLGDNENAYRTLVERIDSGFDKSDDLIIKFCDYARDLGKGYVGEVLLVQLIATGRTGLVQRLADLYREGRDWVALRKLINGMPPDTRSDYIIYLLGRANVFLLQERAVLGCSDILWNIPHPGPVYAQVLMNVWQWRIGDIEASQPECSYDNLPHFIAQDVAAINNSPPAPYRPDTVVKSYTGWRSLRPKENLPNFISIGTQRSATTWLWHQFMRYMDVQQLPFKESVFFSDAFDSPFIVDPGLSNVISPEDLTYWSGPTRNIFRYLRLFGEGRPIRPDFSPSYVELPTESVRVIGDVLGPDIKILLCLRDPIERSWSNLVYDTKLAGIKFQSLTRRERLAHFQSKLSQRRCDYVKVFKRWSAVFSNIKVVFYEDVVSNPLETLHDVLQFAGIADSKYVEVCQSSITKRVNVSNEVTMSRDDRHFLFGFHQDRLASAERMFGQKARAWRLRQMSLLSSSD